MHGPARLCQPRGRPQRAPALPPALRFPYPRAASRGVSQVTLDTVFQRIVRHYRGPGSAGDGVDDDDDEDEDEGGEDDEAGSDAETSRDDA